MKPNNGRKWVVTVRWREPDLDGRQGEEYSARYRFPADYGKGGALEAAAERWDEAHPFGCDWTPSEHDRAARTYRATARLA